jgi:hypothetical protein
LKAWQPILTPNIVISTFAAVGVVFLAIGIAVLVSSNKVVEVKSDNYEGLTPQTGSCLQGTNSTPSSCLVDVSIKITDDMETPIYVYYQLNNFYQNHRRYVKSRSDTQLRGDGDTNVDLCDPLATRSCTKGGVTGTCSVYPCGLIAWSVFNDTFYNSDVAVTAATATSTISVTHKDGTKSNIPWTSENIAWESDKKKKFVETSNPAPVGSTACSAPSSDCLVLPYEGYKYYKCAKADGTADPNNKNCAANLRYGDVENEEFIVWMRTSGLPDFRKLHRIINDKSLKSGDTVTLKVNNVFPVHAFDGEKRIVLSTTTWIGGKNQFLGWAYIVVAILCILLAIAFAVKQAMSPRTPTSSSELEKTIAGDQ